MNSNVSLLFSYVKDEAFAQYKLSFRI